jgi:cytochrome c oxidase subunit III
VPSTPDIQDIPLIIETVRGGGSRGKPPASKDGGDDDKKPEPHGHEPPNRFYTAITVGILSILMLFMTLVCAFVVRRASSINWISFHFPPIVWVNTVILLSSSVTIELARRRLAISDSASFRKWWSITTFLGVLFLIGQIAAWSQLARQGVYLASNPASSFFYIFTGAHAVHVLGGVAALLFVALRNFDRTKISPMTAVRVTSYYWHFLDALWIFLAALLYFGR